MSRFISAVVCAVAVFGVPAAVGAHMGTFGSPTLTDDEVETAEDIMIKMMSGQDLTEGEAQEMVELMRNHHGSYGPVWGGGYGFMPLMFGAGWGYGGTFVYWIVALAMLVWLLLGVLLVALVIKRLKKPNGHER